MNNSCKEFCLVLGVISMDFVSFLSLTTFSSGRYQIKKLPLMSSADELLYLIFKLEAIFGVMIVVTMKLTIRVLMSPICKFGFQGRSVTYPPPWYNWALLIKGGLIVWNFATEEAFCLIVRSSSTFCPTCLSGPESHCQTSGKPRWPTCLSWRGSWFCRNLGGGSV